MYFSVNGLSIVLIWSIIGQKIEIHDDNTEKKGNDVVNLEMVRGLGTLKHGTDIIWMIVFTDTNEQLLCYV